jgi:hypothetical protein
MSRSAEDSRAKRPTQRLRGRGHPVGDQLVVTVQGCVGRGLGQRPVPPHLGSRVPVQQVGGDAVQPRQRAGLAEVEAPPPIERDKHGLTGEIVGELAADPASQEPVHGHRVPVEDDREGIRVRPGLFDDSGVTYRAVCQGRSYRQRCHPEPRIVSPSR